MRRQSGITMISLIVTIIVMVILAGVAISSVVGDDNVIIRSRQAAAATNEAKVNDEVKEAWGNALIEYWEKADNVDKSDYFDGNIDAINKYLKDGKLKSFDYNPEGTSVAVYVSNDDESKEYEVNINTYEGIDDVTSTTTEYVVRFYNADGTTLYNVESVENGKDSTYSTAPTLDNYTFQYWATEPNGTVEANLNGITSNMSVYAYFIADPICFVAGTKVLTNEGLINIEDVTIGMKVYSKNLETNELEEKEVIDTFINYVDKDMTKVTVNGEVIESTSQHEYYTVNRGWVDAQDLVKDDVLLSANDEKLVVENVETKECTGIKYNTVYNFTVRGNHNYYVGNNSVLVHNVPSPSESTDSSGC